MIPTKLAESIATWEGDHGYAWLASLPRLIAELAAAWQLEVGKPFEPGGNVSWVAPVRTRTGDEAVLKVQHPHPESDPEAIALQAWDGQGSARIYAHDPIRRALLLERCTPGSPLADEPGELAAALAGSGIAALLHSVPPPSGVPTLGSALDRWADGFERRLATHPMPDPSLASEAIELARTLPGTATRSVLLHGDLNPTNVLSATRASWLAIDPKPMVGDPAYDGARLVLQPDPLVTANPERTIAERIRLVADTIEVDRDQLTRWCLVDAVQLGTWARATGQHAWADRCDEHARLVTLHLP